MRTAISSIMLILGATALAQCGMTTQIFAGAVYTSPGTCPGYSFNVNTTGGTGPFTIALAHDGIPYQTFSNDPDGDLQYVDPAEHWGWNVVSVQVTDATNCIATASDDGHPWLLFDTYPVGVTTTTDCTTGQRRLYVQTQPAFCITAIHYSLYSYASQTTTTGDAITWPQQGNQRISPFTLAPGNYSFVTGNTWNCGDVICSGNANTFITVPAGDVSAGDCGSNLTVRAALQGALPGGTLMGDSLRAHALLPTTEPYSALGYSYTGLAPGATITQAMLNVTGNNAIVDWVVVELRSPSNALQVLFSRPALLQRDGDVVDRDGDSYVNFPAASGSYYVALRHRNHLGVMTSSPVSLATIPVTVDFRSSSTSCYGTAPRTQVGTVMCLWSGDGNGNGTIGYTGANNDRDPILTAIGGSTPNNSLNNVYDRRDVNLDGVIRYTGTNNDRDPILTNVGSTTPNNTRTQQLP